MNMICGGLKSGKSPRAVIILLALLLCVSCSSKDSAREWTRGDSHRTSEESNIADAWHFDARQYLTQRLEQLDQTSVNTGSEKVTHDFGKVISGWVTDRLAERFRKEVSMDHKIENVPLTLEIGQPEGDPNYSACAIITGDEGHYLVRSGIMTRARPPKIEYSRLTAKEYKRLMRRLIEDFELFNMRSKLDDVIGENLAMTVLEAHYDGDSTLLVFSDYRSPTHEPSKAVLTYLLDSLFWGE